MKAIFLRMLEETGDKSRALREAIASPDQALGQRRFEVEPATFGQVPRSPFAYWSSDSIRKKFSRLPALEANGRLARLGGSTKNDGRFLRLRWEVFESKWVTFAKGGAFSPFYADLYICVNWADDAHEIEAELLQKYPYLGTSADFVLHRENPYSRPGLTWPLRTQSGLSLRAMPAGCIFGHKGPAAFVGDNDPRGLLVLLAITNSRAFRALVDLQMAFGSFEVGVLQRTPVPETNDAVAEALSLFAKAS